MHSVESGYGFLPIPERHPEDCGLECCAEPEPCEVCGEMPDDCNCLPCEMCHTVGPLANGYDYCKPCAEVYEIMQQPLVGEWAGLVAECLNDFHGDVKTAFGLDGEVTA